MTAFAKVTRPEVDAGAAEKAAYLRSLATALEEIGVGYGQEFAVVPAEAIGTQSSLDDLGKQLGPFAKDSETSRKAAIDNYDRANDQHKLILRALVEFKRRAAADDTGLTREEIATITGLLPDAVRPRVLALVGGGMLEVTDRTRKTKAGNDAEVIDITRHGREEWEKAHRGD